MHRFTNIIGAWFLIILIGNPLLLHAQSKSAQQPASEDDQAAAKKDDAAELAKKLANPIANLISVPFQNNCDYGIGDANGTKNTLNFQPVIPFHLNKNINLITRYIIPVVSQYNITGEGQSQGGLGDATISAFFSPTHTKHGTT